MNIIKKVIKHLRIAFKVSLLLWVESTRPETQMREKEMSSIGSRVQHEDWSSVGTLEDCVGI